MYKHIYFKIKSNIYEKKAYIIYIVFYLDIPIIVNLGLKCHKKVRNFIFEMYLYMGHGWHTAFGSLLIFFL